MKWTDGQQYQCAGYVYRCIAHNEHEAVLISLDTGRFFVVPPSEWRHYQQM